MQYANVLQAFNASVLLTSLTKEVPQVEQSSVPTALQLGIK